MLGQRNTIHNTYVAPDDTNTTMSTGPLTSDRVNYLIWRYVVAT